MKHLISLLAFSFLIGCDGEKSNVAPSKDSPEEAASETKPPEAVSVNPNLKYEIEGDAVTITGWDRKASGELFIPAIIKGKPVTKIGDEAFYDCTSLTSITIPDGVTSIGGYAFYECTSLTSITIGNGVTSIGNSAFQSSTNLTSITIPDSVISIGGGAFYECTSLTSITIPNGVTSIGEKAFVNCSSLTSITIPDGVTSIGSSAFLGCTGLTTIEVGAKNVNYTDVNGVLFNKEKMLLHTYPAGKAGANYNIPDSVTGIGYGAFNGCTSLTSVSISNGVTSIGNGAFSGCRSLTTITIPDGVTNIGGEAFVACYSLTSITIPDSVTNIRRLTFCNCTSLTALTFLGDAPKIKNDAFNESSPIIYREADAKGWGDTFAGRPVKLISEKP